MIKTFDRFGFAVAYNKALTNAYQVFEVSTDTDVPQAVAVDNNASAYSVEVSLSVIAGGAALVSMHLTRDTLGNIPITPGVTAGATQPITPGVGAATFGGVVYTVDSDYHYDGRTVAGGSTAEKKIYVAIKLDAGTATADIRVNWRA